MEKGRKEWNLHFKVKEKGVSVGAKANSGLQSKKNK